MQQKAVSPPEDVKRRYRACTHVGVNGGEGAVVDGLAAGKDPVLGNLGANLLAINSLALDVRVEKDGVARVDVEGVAGAVADVLDLPRVDAVGPAPPRDDPLLAVVRGGARHAGAGAPGMDLVCVVAGRQLLLHARAGAPQQVAVLFAVDGLELPHGPAIPDAHAAAGDGLQRVIQRLGAVVHARLRDGVPRVGVDRRGHCGQLRAMKVLAPVSPTLTPNVSAPSKCTCPGSGTWPRWWYMVRGVRGEWERDEKRIGEGDGKGHTEKKIRSQIIST